MTLEDMKARAAQPRDESDSTARMIPANETRATPTKTTGSSALNFLSGDNTASELAETTAELMAAVVEVHRLSAVKARLELLMLLSPEQI